MPHVCCPFCLGHHPPTLFAHRLGFMLQGQAGRALALGGGLLETLHSYHACVFHHDLPTKSGSHPIRGASGEHPSGRRGKVGDR